jgi:glycopeptide antibiotics resistance protein
MKKALLATAMTAVIIICLSLYPFHFRIPSHQIGPVATLLASLHRRPPLRDFLANIVGYLPFGFFFRRGFRQNFDRTGALVLTGLAGAMLSLSMELAQYYDDGRVTSASDLFANTLGTVLGALISSAIRRPV